MFATINGTEIFFDVVGEQLDASTPQLNERETIICLHGGLGFDHGYLRQGLDPLAVNYNLIYVDLRGQGLSAKVPLETITLEQIADDIRALIEVIGLERAIIFGHSAGGFVAQIIAINHPQVVKGLILCNTSSGKAFSPSETLKENVPMLEDRAPKEVVQLAHDLFSGAKNFTLSPKKNCEWMGRTIDYDEMSYLRQEFFRKVGPYYMAPNHMDKFQKVMSFTRRSPEVMDHFVHIILPHYDIHEFIYDIVAPTLIISGAYDWVCTPAASDYISSQIPLSVHICFEDSGHLPFIEEPQVFIRMVKSFIDKLIHPKDEI